MREPADDGPTCRPVEVDGETFRVLGDRPMDDQDKVHFGSIVGAARRRYKAERAAEDAQLVRVVAERVLLVSELALGYRCPACHGKPAVDRWRSGVKKRYVCGCGHRWEPLTRSAEARVGYGSSTTALLRRVAETGELPALPEKTAAEPAKEDTDE